ncbi:metal ABC transporter ATP-binding protein [uncultured Secundilactobacillus sp.]|uniref:metal ABC transporter ATP-binding protein n=1 Tax=uncultured Secundilactobacillus sp. TaxID=2813935 RepID=UPI0025844B13|nr:ATP-binding cassette domain-containing protein [uncultured Secundilactobacillus sp.]
MSEPIVQLDNVSFAFPDKTVIESLSYTLERGAFLSIVGENGVGKTTLMKMVLQELKPSNGRVRFLPNRNSVEIGYVPQFRNIDPEYPLSIRDFIGLNFAGFRTPWLTKKERQRVGELLTETKLTGVSDRPLGQASGGEKQKAYLAQALLDNPNLLILDESTASLDPVAKTELLDLVKSLNQRLGLTVIFVTHDIPLARRYSDQYLFLTPGTYEAGPISALSDEKVAKMNNA